MRKGFILGMFAILVAFFMISTSALGADIELAKKSTIAAIKWRTPCS